MRRDQGLREGLLEDESCLGKVKSTLATQV